MAVAAVAVTQDTATPRMSAVDVAVTLQDAGSVAAVTASWYAVVVVWAMAAVTSVDGSLGTVIGWGSK
jgi:hypothetical protein